MANIKTRKRNQKILNVVNSFGTFSSLIIGAVIQVDLKSEQFVNQPLFFKITTEYIKNNSPLLLLISALLIFIPVVVLRFTSSASILKCIAAKLNTLRDWICCDISGDYDENHRVTLFKYQKWYFGLIFNKKYWSSKWFPWTFERNPWSGWLVPIARSGYTSFDARAVFWAPNSSKKSEGVAGIAWAKGGNMIHFEKLPKISATTSEQNKEKYCQSTKINRGFLDACIREGAFPSRSFLAFALLVEGEQWGVIVIDSQSENGIDIGQMQKAMDVTCILMPILLEELYS
ncbi:hypothetical protein ACEUCL_21205 [Aeromonas dhakensis]|uniref:hypothetical protein n=1 Tax=Aeromonas dhakensis TaxID=196024 RepID=UPI0038D15989